MNLAELSLRKKTVTWVLTILLVVVGWVSYNNLSRLEDPDFTIKDAIVVTPYPGASAAEVEEEVTNVIEKAVQELGQVDWIESRSARGLSSIKIHVKDQYDKVLLPQVWDELRRKVGDYQRQLPPGAGPSIVNDDFGDVYGIYFALTGEGYTFAELKEVAEFLQRELLLVQDVKRVTFYGMQTEVVYVEMSRSRMAALGISQEQIYGALQAKNLPVSAGRVELGTEYIAINPTGEFTSEQQFGDLLISQPGADQLVYLQDVATITRGYRDPAQNLLFFDGQPAIGLGISTISGGNVVNMGAAIDARLEELQNQIPLGIDINAIAHQAAAVTTAIRGFLVSLLQAIAIVVVVLLFAMGLRSGLIIGAVLFLTITGTFIFMQREGIILERISLGALIIALGMLVDNAIVITDGMRVRMSQGQDALSSAKEVVGQTAGPLFGATVVAVLAFAAIGTSEDSTGEYCRSLFQVILISLMLSWVTAVTVTPLLCSVFLPVTKPEPGAKQKEPYSGGFYNGYRKLLSMCIRMRWITVAVVGGIFAASLFGFGFVKQSFFPDSTRPQFFIDFYFREGTHIQDTAEAIRKADEYLRSLEGVTHTGLAVGGGELRFLLTYTPGTPSTNYGQILVSVDDYKRIAGLEHKVQRDLEDLLPEATINVRLFILGPGEGGKIQLRILGPDHDVLRQLATTTKDILNDDGGSKGVRDDTGDKVKVIRPILAEARARRAGLDRPDVAKVLQSGFSGTQTGVYREKEDLIPIVARAPEAERVDVDNIRDLQIWSPAAGRMIPLTQIVNRFDTQWEDAHRWRRDRATMIKVHADPRHELYTEVLARVKPQIELALGVDVTAATGKDVAPEKFTAATIPMAYKKNLPLKGMPGYYISWGGMPESSAKANGALAASLPIFLGMMVVIIIILFNSLRQPLVIWLCVPLALIGVSVGLLVTHQPFGFMAMLGLLSLSGMLIKNAIVLIDQINAEIKSGKDAYTAIVDSGVSRMNPVSMAALTTVLGMAPLLPDAFFVAMAVTIMFGLGFATILTLVVVPVFYAILYRVPTPSK